MVAAVKLYVERYGSNVAGKKIEVILRDDAGVADQARRIAQELVVVNKVAILTGYNPTPPALAVAPISVEAKIPQIVTGSSASITTQQSPYIVRTFATQAQITVPMARWAIKNGIKRVVTLVADYAPGIETEKAFIERIQNKGRRDRRIAARSAAKSGFRCLPAARPRCKTGSSVRLGSRRSRGHVPAAICGARPADVRHQADRSRRHHG